MYITEQYFFKPWKGKIRRKDLQLEFETNIMLKSGVDLEMSSNKNQSGKSQMLFFRGTLWMARVNLQLPEDRKVINNAATNAQVFKKPAGKPPE